MEAIVYFDIETGQVKAVTNEITVSEFPYITVDFRQVKKVMSGHETMDHYRVFRDTETGTYRLESWEEILKLPTDNDTYKIPKFNNLSEVENFDFVVIRNTNNNTWEIQIGQVVLQVLKTMSARSGKRYLEFYITTEDDINILLNTLKVDVLKVGADGYIVVDDDLALPNNISVYCKKLFNSYAFIEK